MIRIKTLIVLLIVYFVFILFSAFFRNKMLYVKYKWVYLFIPLYFIAIYFYYELTSCAVEKKIKKLITYYEKSYA
jgi:hypothetical protein